ncbi:hypothetical protein, partial [Raoultella ornithinolytica]|uniref:hypothetical protein n=1 Tax=Raoultella ornithinolytica TaxID=54291 RepID=UPI00194F2C45
MSDAALYIFTSCPDEVHGDSQVRIFETLCWWCIGVLAQILVPTTRLLPSMCEQVHACFAVVGSYGRENAIALHFLF